VYDKKYLQGAPKTFKSTEARGKEWPENSQYTLQVAPEDCTGCDLCVEVCPAKNKEKVSLKAINMKPQIPLRKTERENWNYFLEIPEVDRTQLKVDTVKGSQFLEPLFEFSGACAGCGETPYVKLASQLFGDRMIVANATGCSSIYGGNLPTTPWTFNKDGRGPSWSNSLFEDNAEFGFGFRLTIDKHAEQARELLQKLKGKIGDGLVKELLQAEQTDEAGIFAQRNRVKKLKAVLGKIKEKEAKLLLSLADYLVTKSVWIIGGDGWAYDIGYGGLDHVIASGRNVNILVLDTEVYSNTGGQMSKATPLGGVAKFAAAGKPTPKKDLAMQAISYGSVYVAKVAMGANDVQTVKAFIEAESYDGPSLIIAYSHCIAHGINMKYGLTQQKLAVDSGYWPLIRFNPALAKTGDNPFKLDSKAPKIPLEDYVYNETRYKMLTKSMPERARMLLKMAQQEVKDRWQLYEKMAKMYDKSETSA
jgi:pyruvate-ferredoxin/flavodoxin oxidoreductase